MDDLIRRKATGNADEFASKLGICRSVLMENLTDLRELGAPIVFDESQCSYRYDGEFTLFYDGKTQLKDAKGGFADYFPIFSSVRYYRTPIFYIYNIDSTL